MWSIIIPILERLWAERRKPRRQLVKDIGLLYRAMEDCAQSFGRFAGNISGNIFGPQEVYRAEWIHDVERLLARLRRIDPTLEIFGPEVRPSIHAYVHFESAYAKAALVNKDDADLRRDDLILLDLGNSLAMGEDAFSEARQSMRKFIRENFTMDEMHEFLRG